VSHLHIPDGMLPPVVWILGLGVALAVLFASARATRTLGPQRIAYQSALGGIMLAVMAIPVPVVGFDYCMTLAGPVGVLLGAAGGFQVAFVVTAILALMGQGGFTVVGLNALVMGAGAAVARPVYMALAGRMRAGSAMAWATAASQTLSSALWIALLLVSVRLDVHLGREHEVSEALQFAKGGLLLAILLPMLAAAVTVESLLALGIARFLDRVRPDLLPETPGRTNAAAEALR
jgi:cobalt/nickel transport system permease protein